MWLISLYFVPSTAVVFVTTIVAMSCAANVPEDIPPKYQENCHLSVCDLRQEFCQSGTEVCTDCRTRCGPPRPEGLTEDSDEETARCRDICKSRTLYVHLTACHSDLDKLMWKNPCSGDMYINCLLIDLNSGPGIVDCWMCSLIVALFESTVGPSKGDLYWSFGISTTCPDSTSTNDRRRRLPIQ